jgi:hypothetical protein
VAWSAPKIGTVATVASGNLTLTEPAGIAEGDLMIACIAIRSTVGFANADWQKIEGQLSGDTDATNGIASGEMWYVVRGASAPSLVFTRTAGDLGHGCIIAYSGGHTSPLDTHSSNTLAVANATATTGTITTAEAGELIVAMSSAGDNLTASAFDATDPATASGATDTTTAPTNGTWIERFDAGTNTGADGGLAIADAIRQTAGATGTIQTTISASARHVMIAAAFKLAVSTPVEVTPGVGSLTLTGLAAAVIIGTVLTPATGSLDLTGFAPTVTTTNHVTVTPSLGSLTLTGFAPTVTASNHQTVTPGVGTLTLTGFAPTIAAGTSAEPGVGSLTLTGFAPSVSVSDHQTVTPSLGSLILTGFAPTITAGSGGGGTTVEPGLGALTLTGFAPTISASDHITVTPSAGSLTLTGYAPSADVDSGLSVEQITIASTTGLALSVVPRTTAIRLTIIEE